MRKAASIILSLILVILFSCNCFAAIYTYNPFTGEIEGVTGNDTNTNTVEKIQLNPTCYYSIKDRMFIYCSASREFTGSVCSKVADGECVTDPVSIKKDGEIEFDIYMDGELLEASDDLTLKSPGEYIVKDKADDSTMFEFTILGSVTGLLYEYNLPSVYYLTKYSIDGNTQMIYGNTVDMETEGNYQLAYYNSIDNTKKVLNIMVDHTAPTLEIIGVENGEAHQAVSFGELEDGSSLEILLDGTQINYKEEYTSAGDYHVIYSDKAGNTSEYDFTIYTFIDLKAWIVIAVVALCNVGLGIYMIYCRKNMPRS